MGSIVELQSRHYFGTAADMATIAAACRCAGDLYTQTDTKATYVYDGAVWQGPVPADWITAAMLKTDSVETLKIKNVNVTAAKLAVDSVETLKIKNLNVTIGKAALGFGRYVARPSNAWDKVVGDFTTNGAWQVDGLDLSGIVPAGATGVVLGLNVVDDAANSRFAIRQDAAYNSTILEVYTNVVNIPFRAYTPIAIESNRLMDYYGDNLAFTNIDLVVMGWFT